ncbi:HPr-rel-A system PqqD family peptide chaperone [Roseateles sp.]|uniref:HPr-rel-A system PqqD family peptide chaperone n=1 Tax=Roseateles sp. TaxID=1971397 RepID=UPI003BAD96EB
MPEPRPGELSLWRVPQGCGLRFKTLDAEGLVFNALSGDTHLLSSSGFEILQFLAQQDVHAWSSSAAVTCHLLGDAEVEMQAQVEKNLLYLAQLGLVEQKPS